MEREKELWVRWVNAQVDPIWEPKKSRREGVPITGVSILSVLTFMVPGTWQTMAMHYALKTLVAQVSPQIDIRGIFNNVLSAIPWSGFLPNFFTEQPKSNG
jgi:hypothetical protein